MPNSVRSSTSSSVCSNSTTPKVSSEKERIFLGAVCPFVHDLSETLQHLNSQRIYLAIVPLFHPRFSRDAVGISDAREGEITRSDLVLDSASWQSYVVGLISSSIELDSKNDQIRQNSEKMLKQEVAWATHLSVSAVLLPTPTNGIKCANYAHMVNQLAQQTRYLNFWISIPLLLSELKPENISSSFFSVSKTKQRNSGESAFSIEQDLDNDSWEVWNFIRTMCDFNPKIGIALELTADLPAQQVLDRWLGERIRAVILPVHIFLTNRKGYPTLSTRHQTFFGQLLKFKIQYYFKGKPRHFNSYLPYVQYIEHLSSKLTNSGSNSLNQQKEFFENPYLDVLQAPLQPLMDNLESQTYETFEKDPIKYQEYERAIAKALSSFRRNAPVILMVVGAGRGPLVRCALRAADTSGTSIRVYAVEKNPNAVITLRNMKKTDKWHNVTIVHSDMREWKAPEKADILVSELLGSFGDNELSPECLDGAQSFLADGGISIPSRYVSFAAPILSSKLWNSVKEFDSSVKSFETPYVVRLHTLFSIAKPRPVFEFTHPNPEVNLQKKGVNERFTSVSYLARESSLIHGFAGYFEADLYEEVYISINPDSHSPGMFSWFPIFFPIIKPLYVAKGQQITLHMWRKCQAGKVWYEWSVGVQNQGFSAIHNPNGRSYWIGL